MAKKTNQKGGKKVKTSNDLTDEDLTLYLAIVIAIGVLGRQTYTRTRERVCIKACQNLQKFSFLSDEEQIEL